MISYFLSHLPFGVVCLPRPFLYSVYIMLFRRKGPVLLAVIKPCAVLLLVDILPNSHQVTVRIYVLCVGNPAAIKLSYHGFDPAIRVIEFKNADRFSMDVLPGKFKI